MTYHSIEDANRFIEAGDWDAAVAWYEEEERINMESSSPWAVGNLLHIRLHLESLRQKAAGK